jgi:1-acyl-sn-glycerol-3-phosphate acyltransferase
MHGLTSAEALLEIISRIAMELHPDANVLAELTLDSALESDLGLDSLARMELLRRVEKEFGIRLPEKVLVSAETPRDLMRHLGQGGEASTDEAGSLPVFAQERDKRRNIGFSHAKTLLDVLHFHVEAQPDANHITLLEDENEVCISYAMLQRQSLRIATRLHLLQMEPGDTIAIMLPTSRDYFYCFFGVLYGGGVPVPLYPPARPTQIEEHVRRHRKILSNAGATILVTVPEVKPVARLLMSQVVGLKRIVTVDELYADVAREMPLIHKGSDVAFMQYTSGSTGDPKGVILTHANLLANVRAMGQVCKVTTDDVFVSWLPLYHDMGLIGAWFGSLCYGCRLVVMSPLSFLARPQRWLQAVDRYSGTLSASPNFGYEICATRLEEDDLTGLDLSSWRMAFNGAEPVIPATMRRFEKRFRAYGFREEALAPVYGLAESSVGLAFPSPGSGLRIDRVVRRSFSGSGSAIPAEGEDDSNLEFVSCGRPLPGHQLRVVDTQGREMPERQEGRLQFKGPSSTCGYFRNQEETRKLFSGDWLETGDLAYIAAGEVYLTSRQKDIIIRGGRNIYPHELEERIGDIEGIRKGCSAAFASMKAEDSAEKLVILTESRQTDLQKLRNLKQEVFAVTVDLLGMGPDDIVIGRPGTVLKTSSGKIRRSACRQLYESGHIGRKKAAVWLQLLRMGVAGIKPALTRLSGRIGSLCYACYCWLTLGLTGFFVWWGILMLPAGGRCWKLAGMVVRILCRMTGIKVTVDGLEQYPFGQRYLLVSNHMSYLDSIILTGILPEKCNFVAKAELARNPFLHSALKKLGVFLVDRFDTGQSVEDTRKIEAGVQRGLRPLFFAEGTLQRMPGLLPFQMGAFVLASQEGIPVLPVTIRGTRNILRGGSWFPRHSHVQITVGELCAPAGSDWSAAVELRDRVRRQILDRLGEPDLAGEFISLSQMEIERP